MGQFDRVMEDFDRLITKDPDEYLATFNRGAAEMHSRQYDRVAQDFEKLVKLASTNVTIVKNALKWLWPVSAEIKRFKPALTNPFTTQNGA